MTPSSIGSTHAQQSHAHHGSLVCAHPWLHLYRYCPQRDVLVCRTVGEVDLLTAPLLARELRSIENNGQRVRTVVVDLSETTFLGAAGADVVLQASARALAERRELAVVGRTTAVRRTLQITGIEEALHRYASVSDAVGAARLHTRHLRTINDHSSRDHSQPRMPGYPATLPEHHAERASGTR